ncbi:MAG: FkbM family methyltransferase [Acetobacteraceae bacterium]
MSTGPLALLLARKASIESAMYAEPRCPHLRAAYLEALWTLIRRDLGPTWANLPELRAPLLLRGGTSDLGNLAQVFFNNFADATGPYRYGDYGFDMAEPDYILDLGAYCGYAAVYLANRFPRARILSVEPPGPNFDALRINAAPYPNVTCLDAAVWHQRTGLRLGGHLLGDWGTYFTEAGSAQADGLVEAYTIPDLLAKAGWPRVDYLKCVVEGAQVDILAGPDRPWLDAVQTVSTRPPTGVWPNPDDETRLFNAFPEDRFVGAQIGELVVMRRRPETMKAPAPSVVPIRLLPQLPDSRPYVLHHVGDDVDRFYRFDHAGLQLAPNAADSPPATIVFPLTLAGHRRFVCQVGADAGDGRRIICHLTLTRPNGETVVTANMALTDAAPVEWVVSFAAAAGPHELSLSTEQVGNSGTGGGVMVRFLDPQLQ